MKNNLYRGIRKDNGEWAYGAYFAGVQLDLIISEVSLSEYSEARFVIAGYEVERETVGQYIGLEDVNEDYIFSGDIVEIELFGRKIESTVIYMDEMASYVFEIGDGKIAALKPSAECKMKIVGNIHKDKRDE